MSCRCRPNCRRGRLRFGRTRAKFDRVGPKPFGPKSVQVGSGRIRDNIGQTWPTTAPIRLKLAPICFGHFRGESVRFRATWWPEADQLRPLRAPNQQSSAQIGPDSVKFGRCQPCPARFGRISTFQESARPLVRNADPTSKTIQRGREKERSRFAPDRSGRVRQRPVVRALGEQPRPQCLGEKTKGNTTVATHSVDHRQATPRRPLGKKPSPERKRTASNHRTPITCRWRARPEQRRETWENLPAPPWRRHGPHREPGPWP